MIIEQILQVFSSDILMSWNREGEMNHSIIIIILLQVVIMIIIIIYK